MYTLQKKSFPNVRTTSFPRLVIDYHILFHTTNIEFQFDTHKHDSQTNYERKGSMKNSSPFESNIRKWDIQCVITTMKERFQFSMFFVHQIRIDGNFL